jgi:(E)-4-hydroxy-3-methyl-but-2-enyl pyrophosphate reductase
MRVIIANSAGFCMGVRQAMDKAFMTLRRERGKIYTYGPLIHNPQVVRLLAEKGVSSITDIPTTSEGTIVIRAHGISPTERERIKQTKLAIVDATCPKVMKIHAAAKKHHKQGYLVVVVGDRDHPEVSGILGYTEGKGMVVGSPEEVGGLPDADRVLVVAQTTFGKDMFEKILGAIAVRYPDAVVEAVDTLCDSTKRRQDEVKELAKRVDAMVVVGGRESGNTRRLYEVAKAAGVPAFHIEDESGLDPKAFASFRTVGLTAGASTPNWVIMRVCDALTQIDRDRHGRLTEGLARMFRFVVLGYIWAGLAAGGLAAAAALLMGVESFWTIPIISGLYIFSMHVINWAVDLEATRFNDPARERLYVRGRPFLLAAGIVGSFAAIFFAWLISPIVTALVAAAVVAGIAFTIRIVPERLSSYFPWRRIKDIPASKTFFLAGGWAAVSAGVPYLSAMDRVPIATFLSVFVFCFLLVFIRASLYDVRDIQGESVVGRETIPIIIGTQWTQRLVVILTMAAAALLFFSCALGIISSLGWWLLSIPAYSLLVSSLYEGRLIFQGISFEVVVDFEFILAGIIASVWFLAH